MGERDAEERRGNYDVTDLNLPPLLANTHRVIAPLFSKVVALFAQVLEFCHAAVRQLVLIHISVWRETIPGS